MGPTERSAGAAEDVGAEEYDEKQSALLNMVFNEYSITAEYSLFIRQNLPGVYCVPKAENPFEWFGVLFLRQGPYQGGIFRFELRIPQNFYEINRYSTDQDQDDHVTIKFELTVFHPLINPATKIFDASAAYTGLNFVDYHVHHALIYLQKIFFAVDTENAVNLEAANLFKSDPIKFQEKVTETVRKSREVVYDAPQSSDEHAIRFTPWDQTIHDKVRSTMLKKNRTTSADDVIVSANAQTSGLSFMDPSVVFRL